MFSCGARRGKILGMRWEFVQLDYCRATLRDIKSRPEDTKDRIVDLEPRALAVLREMQGDRTSGPVCLRADGKPWHPDPKISGSQLNRALKEAANLAGITRRVFLHMTRHSWAPWHYSVHRDLKKLKDDGAWESLDMAGRYSHLAPAGMVPEILKFWGRTEGQGGAR